MNRLNSVVLGLVCCAGLTSATLAGTTPPWQLESANLQYWTAGEDGGSWNAYTTVDVGIASQQLPTGIKLYGDGEESRAFSLAANQILSSGTNSQGASHQLVLRGTAQVNIPVWDSNLLQLPTTFGFGWEFDNGNFQLASAETSFQALDSMGQFLAGVGSGFGDQPFGDVQEPGGYGIGFEFVDNFGGVTNDLATINWEVRIGFNWFNQTLDDSTLHFNIPQDSIDIFIRPVPTPSAAALLGLSGLVAMRRRR